MERKVKEFVFVSAGIVSLGECLLGIISRKVMKFDHRGGHEGIVALPNGFAGYFVPASEIALFIPPKFQF
jgi:hypothetical protein